MKLTIALCALVLVVAPVTAAAHSGGLNAEGCHNDRKNGGYHCHRGSGFRAAPSRPQGQPPRPLSGGAFANCAAARAAGASPGRRGDPGYGSHLDRDGDGVGCERG
ncbi:excalibur calcium-binding domain-containing protein [Brevundimonas sp. TWP1-2-1b1]|uniref:excalibur calcium-binding domain-containing protein n=1 Tax=unclassified Brevundimonas TaxID=2622653 RepID=UPI003CEE87A3